MTSTNSTHAAQPSSLMKFMAIGALIGLAAISFFVFQGDTPPASWGANWKIRPLIITPLSGAIGGLCFYFITRQFAVEGWNRILGIVISLIICFVGLWMGIVLGLAGTMWN